MGENGAATQSHSRENRPAVAPEAPGPGAQHPTRPVVTPAPPPRPQEGVDGPDEAAARAAAAAALGPPTFGQFYEQHFTGLVRLAVLLTGSSEVAADLVQDCFVRLHGHWSGVRQPLPYVRRSVVHACASHHRSAARARRTSSHLVPGATELGADELGDALAKLAPKQRAAIVLRFYDDLPEDDIARALRCRPATVRSLVHRGLAELRKVIEP
jgi:DNA-directed RNA polymerase specialized sigma24 family protein